MSNMEELDLLKQHWNKDEKFPRINKEEIQRMLHKSSSSLVKWILIICCLEFVLGIVLSYYMSSDDDKESQILDYFSWCYDIAFYAGIIYFIYRFYILYSKINSTSNTKTLVENIVNVRNNANLYIKFNLIFINIAFVTAFISIIVEEYIENNTLNPLLFIAAGLVLLLVAFLFKKIVRLYYRVLYGILLKRLNKNYEELVKLEE